MKPIKIIPKGPVTPEALDQIKMLEDFMNDPEILAEIERKTHEAWKHWARYGEMPEWATK